LGYALDYRVFLYPENAAIHAWPEVSPGDLTAEHFRIAGRLCRMVFFTAA